MLDIKQFYTKFIAPVAGKTPYGSVKNETVSGANDGSTVLAGMITNMAYVMYQVLAKTGDVPNNVTEDLDSATPTSQQFILSLVKAFLDRSEFTAKGDLVLGTGVATSGSEIGILTIGADGTVLTADSTSTNGIKWSASAGAGGGSSMQAIYNAVKEFKETGNNNLIDDTADFLTNNTSENAEIIRAFMPAVYNNSSGPANLKMPLWFGTSDQLAVIDDLDVVSANLSGDLNGGGGSIGTLAQDSSNQTEGTACVSATFTSADTWAGYSFDFSADPQSLDDKSLIAAIRAQSVSLFDNMTIIATDGSAVTATIVIPISEFTADTWYYGAIVNPKKVTYSAVGFDKNDVQTLQFLFHVTAPGSPYTGNIKIDFLCNIGVDEFLAKDGVGDYEPRSIIVYDTGVGNKSVVWVKDYALGIYDICDFMTDNLSTPLSHNFPNSLTPADVQTVDVFRRGGIASNGVLPITSGESEAYWCQSAYPEIGKTNQEINSVESTTSFPYQIIDIIKGSNQIIISSATDISADFPNDTEILLTRLQNGRSINLLGGDPTDAIKVTNRSYSNEQLTLTIDNTALLASVPDDTFTEWSLVRIDVWGWIKDKITGVVSREDILGIRVDAGIGLFFDDFNRTNSTSLGNNWNQTNSLSNQQDYGIVSNHWWAEAQTGDGAYAGTAAVRTTENYAVSPLGITGDFVFEAGAGSGSGYESRVGFYLQASNPSFTTGLVNNYTTGSYVTFQSDGTSTTRIKIGDSDGDIVDTTSVFSFLTQTFFRIFFGKNITKVKVWTGATEPSAWTYTASKPSGFLSQNNGQMVVEVSQKNGSGGNGGKYVYLDNFNAKKEGSGIVLSSKTSTSQLEIVKRIEDTTQNPELNESVAKSISN